VNAVGLAHPRYFFHPSLQLGVVVAARRGINLYCCCGHIVMSLRKNQLRMFSALVIENG
jgi:hypothetical protein